MVKTKGIERKERAKIKKGMDRERRQYQQKTGERPIIHQTMMHYHITVIQGLATP